MSLTLKTFLSLANLENRVFGPVGLSGTFLHMAQNKETPPDAVEAYKATLRDLGVSEQSMLRIQREATFRHNQAIKTLGRDPVATLALGMLAQTLGKGLEEAPDLATSEAGKKIQELASEIVWGCSLVVAQKHMSAIRWSAHEKKAPR